MALGTTAAILTAAGIGAAANVGQAAIQSKAAKGAAKTQSQAADKAAALYEPFYQTGVQANNTLASLMGLGPATMGTGSPDVATRKREALATNPVVRSNVARAGGKLGEAFGVEPPGSPAYGPGVPIQGPQMPGQGGRVSSYARGGGGTLGAVMGAPASAAEQLVQLQSPTGEVGMVPMSAVEHYLARGARRV